MTAATPILQIGTGRFLQAHADLFVSDAMERGEALGPITVVQTTGSAESARRVAAMAAGGAYPVRIQGLVDGAPVDRTVTVRSVARALAADADWPALRRIAADEAAVILSNTGERGYELSPDDGPDALTAATAAPRSYPAKLANLLHARWQARPAAPLTVLPCELTPRNGERLGGIVRELARAAGAPGAFTDWLSGHVVWGVSLVDRIVSGALEPAGAVCEPYALWAIEAQPGLVPPCRHEAIAIVPDLVPIERRKLHLLNLGHTVLADHWRAAGAAPARTVLELMRDEPARAVLEAVWTDEVLPVFAAWGDDAAPAYAASVRDRFSNPFLAHRMADIAGNHAAKLGRRIAPVVEAGAAIGLRQPLLRAALARGGAAA